MPNERLNLTPFDFTLRDEGSIYILVPENDSARTWVDEHLYGDDGHDVPWWGGGVVIEHRLVAPIVEALEGEGYLVALR